MIAVGEHVRRTEARDPRADHGYSLRRGGSSFKWHSLAPINFCLFVFLRKRKRAGSVCDQIHAKIFLIASDLRRIDVRNEDMLDSSLSLGEFGACGNQAAYASFLAGVTRRRENGTRKAVSVNETKWAEQVWRIRTSKDQAAFAELFRHFAPRVKGFLLKSGASETEAEECTQDAMATLWRKAHLFDPTRASVATWVFTIARNRRIDLLRKSRRPEPEDLPWGPEAEPDQEDVVALRQETEKLGEALKQLPEKQRELVEKAYFGDLSHSEIAAETGLPLGTIKSRIRLALERLRHEMK